MFSFFARVIATQFHALVAQRTAAYYAADWDQFDDDEYELLQ